MRSLSGEFVGFCAHVWQYTEVLLHPQAYPGLIPKAVSREYSNPDHKPQARLHRSLQIEAVNVVLTHGVGEGEPLHIVMGNWRPFLPQHLQEIVVFLVTVTGVDCLH